MQSQIDYGNHGGGGDADDETILQVQTIGCDSPFQSQPLVIQYKSCLTFLARSISSRVQHTDPISTLQSQILTDGSDSEDESKLGVPTPNSDLRFSASQSKTIPRLPSNSKHGWAVAGAPPLPSPGPRRAPISLGLSLKQQVSSPRYLPGDAQQWQRLAHSSSTVHKLQDSQS